MIHQQRSTDPFRLLAKIAQLADEDVDEDAEVISVEVFLCAGRREEQVEDFQDQERNAERIGRAV